jgi:hypothetical protein
MIIFRLIVETRASAFRVALPGPWTGVGRPPCQPGTGKSGLIEYIMMSQLSRARSQIVHSDTDTYGYPDCNSWSRMHAVGVFTKGGMLQ